MSKVKKIWNMPIHSKDIAFLNLNFPPFCAILVTKWRKTELSKRYIFWMDWFISKIFSPLTSLWWLLSETIIRYPLIQKRNLAGTLWRHFPAKNAKIWKREHTFFWNGDFHIVAKFQVNCIKTYKRWIKVGTFDVTYAHRERVKLVLWNSKNLARIK